MSEESSIRNEPRTFRTISGATRTWSPSAYEGGLRMLRVMLDLPAADRLDALALVVMAGYQLATSTPDSLSSQEYE